MSRIGKKEILIPEGVTVKLKDRLISVSGPKGTLELEIRPEIQVEIGERKINIKAKPDKIYKAIHGTTRQNIANMIEGVKGGWSKTLEVVGTGYRAVPEGGKLVFSLGFSHRTELVPPEGITFSVAENKVTISGADKVLVGQIAAKMRGLRVPDAYKGKGIRYQGERIRLKPGKATKVGAAGGAAK